MKNITWGFIPAIIGGVLIGGCSLSEPAKNPYLSADKYGITHFDSAQTDSVPYPLAAGTYSVDLKKQPHVSGGPVNIMTFASNSEDYMWGVSSQGLTYIDVRDGEFKEVARYNVPGMKVITPQMHEKMLRAKYKNDAAVDKARKEVYGVDYLRMFSGIYSAVDNNNIVYANYNLDTIYAFGLKNPNNPSEGIEVKGEYKVNFLKKGETLAGINMTYDGNLILVGNRSIIILDRDFNKKSELLRFGDDEFVTNSVAIDENNGIYIASDKYMRKLVWTGTKLSDKESDGAWKSEYTTGQQPPAVKVGKGTGSTPTLMGFGSDEDKLVVITDGANRMNLVAFWRDEIPADFKQKPGTKSRRIADQIAVTAGLPLDKKWVQTEQSVVAKGYGAFVVNNIVAQTAKDRLTGVIALGPVDAPPYGAERFEWDTEQNKWRSVWTRGDVSSVSTVPSVSVSSNMVLINGYYKNSGWEVQGLDWNTGATVHRSIFGQDNFGNGAYAIMQLFPDGDFLFNSIAGPHRIHYTK